MRGYKKSVFRRPQSYWLITNVSHKRQQQKSQKTNKLESSVRIVESWNRNRYTFRLKPINFAMKSIFFQLGTASCTNNIISMCHLYFSLNISNRFGKWRKKWKSVTTGISISSKQITKRVPTGSKRCYRFFESIN